MKTLLGIVVSARPKQWVKNLIVFAPALFAGVLFHDGVLARLGWLFAQMCIASAAVYLVNDIVDRDADRAYARTRERPLASGVLRPRTAAAAAVVLASTAVVGAWLLDPAAGITVAAYLLAQLAYTFGLKRVVIADMLSIALGFNLRAIAGAYVVGVPHSLWLLACTTFLVLFLSAAKRRQEIVELGAAAEVHRAVLGRYSRVFLERTVTVSALVTGTVYMLYTTVGAGRHHPGMVLTALPVLFGLYRYLVVSYSAERTGTAEEIMLTDAPMVATVVLWVVAVLVLVYVA